MAGILSKNTKLYYKTTGESYSFLDLLTEVPEMGGSVEKVDVTTLTDGVKKYINGIKDLGELEFKFLYDTSSASSSFRKLKEFEDENQCVSFKVEYPDGTSCLFDAYVSVKVDSASVGAVITFTAAFALQTDLEWNITE